MADYRVKLKEREKLKKTFKFARFKKNMKQECKIVIGTILKKFVKKLQEDQKNIESNQTMSALSIRKLQSRAGLLKKLVVS